MRKSAMRSSVKKNMLLLSLAGGIMFFVSAFTFLDPDFGWHVQMGNLILRSGIPATDPFSYTMPSYRFIDHEWLTNVIVSKIYWSFGYFGLALTFTVLGLISLFLIAKIALRYAADHKIKPVNWNLWLCIFLSFGAVYPFFGVRPQVESWLLFSILIAFIYIRDLWERYAYLLPLLTVLWVNLHGSFALSTVTLLIFFGLKSVRQKHIDSKAGLVFFLSVLASFINPYGPRVWYEVWQQITDDKLRFLIMEWRPAFFSFNLSYIALLALSSLLIIKYRKNFKLEHLAINFFYMFQSLSSARHEPIWILANFPMILLALGLVQNESQKIKFGKDRFNKFMKIAVYAFMPVVLVQSAIHLYSVSRLLSEKNFYPAAAINYLKSQHPAGRIFSQYGWGGYLILNLPEEKVFIDGRMASWKRDASPENESKYAMEEYMDILSGDKNYNEFFRKYGIDTVVWPKKEYIDPFSVVEKKNRKIFNPLYNLFGIKNRDFKLVDTLKNNGWSVVYSDNVSLILQKK